MGKIRQCFKPS